jgi:hypothetical protein
VMHLQASKLNFALWQVLLSLVHYNLQASGDARPNIQSQLKGAFSGYWIVRWSLTGGILDDSVGYLTQFLLVCQADTSHGVLSDWLVFLPCICFSKVHTIAISKNCEM